NTAINEPSLAVRYTPDDRYSLVYIIFFLMGIGSLLPWNFFVTAKSYCRLLTSWMISPLSISNNIFHLKGCCQTSAEMFCPVHLWCWQLIVLCSLVLSRLSPNVRILSSLFVILLVFVGTTILVKVDVSGCREEFFAGTLASVAVVSGASNVFCGSVFGISGHFPMRISQAMGGTLSAVASIADIALAKDVTESALAYFLTADIFILLCIFAYLFLPKLAFSRSDRRAHQDKQPFVLILTPRDKGEWSVNLSTGGEAAPSQTPPLKPILQKTWVLGMSVFYVFCVTIMVFPAVLSGIQSVDKDSGSPWTNTYFVPLAGFLLYNVADFCGRQSTAWLQVPGPTSRLLPVLVVCRSVLVPLIIFCNYQPRDHLHVVLFTHDVYPIVFNSLLGFSNGYLGTLPMIYGPKVVPRELAEATGVVMSFFLALGLTTGSALSLVLVHII
uniref:Solute carrier family 29 member 3 n=1 Tax=Hippocampus comes TaxID=109280 RepID=A0A3Q2XXK2_HIPCM